MAGIKEVLLVIETHSIHLILLVTGICDFFFCAVAPNPIMRRAASKSKCFLILILNINVYLIIYVHLNAVR